MSALGFISILLGLSAAWFAFLRPDRVRVTFFVLAYLLHIAASVAYYQITKNSSADAQLYYFDPTNMYDDGFGFSTQFIVFVVQWLRLTIGGTFLDYFLLFHVVGFFGIALLMRIFEEVYAELNIPQPIWTYLLVLLPSLHYWSGALGKDSLFFFAVALAIWGAMSLRRRLVYFGAAMLLMLLIRPHVAVLGLTSIALTILPDRSTKLWMRAGLAIVAAMGATYAAATFLSTFKLESGSDIVSDRAATREQVLQSEDAGRSSVNAIYPIRVLSLLFRPLFFDVRDMLGGFASVENVLIVILFCILLFRLRLVISLIRRVPYVRFCFWFSASLVLVLGWDYYNIGLGLRQKWTMIMPNILVIYLTMVAVRASQARGGAALATAWPSQAYGRGMDPRIANAAGWRPAPPARMR
ncbi:MAG TPA: hypothetical protein VF759_04985 [Allosphingosinicella sp.]|jgi:hypothetical protein